MLSALRSPSASITALAGIALMAIAVVGVTASDAVAQDDATKGTERRVKGIGLGIGNAYVCVAEDQREAFKEEAHILFDLIVQDMGSDMAFAYATGLGAGSTITKDKLDCEAMLSQWERIREDYDLAEAN